MILICWAAACRNTVSFVGFGSRTLIKITVSFEGAMKGQEEEWNKRMRAAYRCREGDQKKTMQQQPEKEGEPAAWLLVLWLMRSLRGLPQNVECLQRVSQRLGRGQSATKGETQSLKIPQQNSVKWFLGNEEFPVPDGYCILSLTISADRPYLTIMK